MKKRITLLLLMGFSVMCHAQWDHTHAVTPNTSQYAFSNSMVEVTASSPGQLWTLTKTDIGCGTGFWVTKTDVTNGQIPSNQSWQVTLTGWELRAEAIEESSGDIFIAGSMTECSSGTQYPFIMAMDNSGTFAGAKMLSSFTGGTVVDIVKTSSSPTNFLAIGSTPQICPKTAVVTWDVFSAEFDAGLTINNSVYYPIPETNFPYQATLNTAGNVTVVGTEFGGTSPTQKLFTMELDPTGAPVGNYIDYVAASGSSSIYGTPSIRPFQGTDFVITCQVETTVGNTDILVASMDQTTRGINWANSYDFEPTDDAVQGFDEAGDLAITYHLVDNSSNNWHGIMHVDNSGVFQQAENYTPVAAPDMIPFVSLQLSSANDEYYVGSTLPNALNIVKQGQNLSSTCESTRTTSEVNFNFTDNSTSYTDVFYNDHSTTTFIVSVLNGNTTDCIGTSISTFKRSTNIAETNSTTFKVYPTVTNNLVNIDASETIVDVNIYNMQGQLVENSKLLNENQISLAKLNPGQYVIRIESETQSYKTLIQKLN